FLAMEYLDGMDLAMKIYKEGALPVPLACEYVRQAAIGLQHTHEAGVVHRDIKPSHLLVTGSHSTEGGGGNRHTGVVKLVDMGLARLTCLPEVDGAGLPVGQTVIGTADYMAPEQARDATKADVRADIYSLGFIFFRLLCGQP